MKDVVGSVDNSCRGTPPAVNARSAGLCWQKIGALLGTSAQAAQQRYATVVEASSLPAQQQFCATRVRLPGPEERSYEQRD